MQIDFHHTATYTIARMAGFMHNEANIIAYSAQYVDDSTTSGFIEFGNGMRYQRFATAHPPKDYQNATNNNENAQSWQPFHFLPGNTGLQAGVNTSNVQYDDRLICLPDSPVAKAMMASVISSKTAPWGLYRLGIAAHVFVDTFAHQNFVGLNHELNEVKNDIKTDEGKILIRLPLPPVGHAQVDTYPDRPYLKWSYTKGNGTLVNRSNPEIFLNAAKRLFEEFKRYQAGDAAATPPQMERHDQDALLEMLTSLQSDDENERHNQWLEAIGSGYFSFGKQTLSYDGNGIGSWKRKALGEGYIAALAEKIKEASLDEVGAQANVKADDVDDFLKSDYKLFHDAARAHRHLMLTEVFPSFWLFIG